MWVFSLRSSDAKMRPTDGRTDFPDSLLVVKKKSVRTAGMMKVTLYFFKVFRMGE